MFSHGVGVCPAMARMPRSVHAMIKEASNGDLLIGSDGIFSIALYCA